MYEYAKALPNNRLYPFIIRFHVRGGNTGYAILPYEREYYPNLSVERDKGLWSQPTREEINHLESCIKDGRWKEPKKSKCINRIVNNYPIF